MPLTRREFLLDSAGTTLFASVGPQRKQRSNYPFRHGIASGDPLTDRVILWTRITPAPETTDSELTLRYRWLMATDVALTQVVRSGQGQTSAQRDFTAKVDVDGLSPGQTYYYAFEVDGHWSDVGRTRTLPTGRVDHLRIAYTSCSNFAKGFFNVYKELAKRADLDVVLHLGDYIYEYAELEDCVRTGRVNEPLKEIRSLDEYRTRHACYKRDKDLQEVHRQHPFMVIWDDHEVANNAWVGGAEQHSDADSGDWRQRLNGAVRAYLEWMPIREPDRSNMGIYRSFRFGDLVDLSMLDTRLAGRDRQADTLAERDRNDRTLLGFEQESWFYSQLVNAQQQQITWKLMGQQVMVAQLGTNTMPINYDQWDGYPAARQRLFDCVRQSQVDNFVVLTGDIHSSWALELYDDPFAGGEATPLGVEFVTPAVTSEGIANQTRASLAASSVQALLPHLHFVDFFYRGYVLLDITHERLQAEWWVVDNVASHRYSSDCLRAVTVEAGSARLQDAVSVSNAKASAPLAPAFANDLAFLRRWQPAAQDSSEQMVAVHSEGAY